MGRVELEQDLGLYRGQGVLGGQRGEAGLQPGLHLDPEADHLLDEQQVVGLRLSGPDDLAALIVFLASGANHNVSGELVREGSATGRSAHAG